jgi:hypothetical protein
MSVIIASPQLHPTSSWARDSATLCRLRGWRVGTLLVEERPAVPDHPLMLRISALGDSLVLACDPRHHELEAVWSLTCRDWRAATPVEKKVFYSHFDCELETNDPTLLRK